MPVFEIRRYRLSDHDAVWELHNLALNQVGAHAGNGPWDDDLHHIETVYLQDGGEFLVGVLDGQIVAMGALRRVDDGGEDAAWAEIKRMRVHPNFQRQGLGQAVLQQLEACAVKQGYTCLTLDTTTVQVGAQRFYEKNGYTQVGQTKFGPFDVLLYQKEL